MHSRTRTTSSMSSRCAHPQGPQCASYVYSDLVGYQTSEIRLLWTITPNSPPPPQHPFYPPPPVRLRPPRVPPNIRLVSLSPHP